MHMRWIALALITISFTCVAILGNSMALAQSAPLSVNAPMVFDVRRNIPLKDDAPTYRDCFITGGSSQGLKANYIVTAVRKVALRDSSGAQILGEVTIPVAQLRIIMVTDKVAIARELNPLDRDKIPMLDQPWVMVGDLIETKGSTAFVEPTPATIPNELAPEPAKSSDSSTPAPVPQASPEVPTQTPLLNSTKGA